MGLAPSADVLNVLGTAEVMLVFQLEAVPKVLISSAAAVNGCGLGKVRRLAQSDVVIEC
jgi:hypothetical protein